MLRGGKAVKSGDMTQNLSGARPKRVHNICSALSRNEGLAEELTRRRFTARCIRLKNTTGL
jgi:hypothetical protein